MGMTIENYTQPPFGHPLRNALTGNWIDIAILAVVAWNIADGARRGFVGALVSLAGFILSAVIALSFYPQAAGWIASQWGLPELLANPAAFACLWFATGIVVSIVGHVVGAPFAALLRGSALNVLLSVVPSVLKGVAVSGFALMLILSVPPLPQGGPGEKGFSDLREAVQASEVATALVERTAAFDRYAREVIGEPISQTLTLLTIRPETHDRVDLSFRIASPAIDEAAEAQMLELINKERAQLDMKPLVRDPKLDAVARDHSIEMLQKGYFAHDTLEGQSPFDRMRDGGVGFNRAGENLALAPTVGLAHQGLMDSPGHRANILQPAFGRVGIGAARADGRGRMFTQDFAD